ncbi:MAG TPA: nitroreductase family protein [Acidimicrobiales bacterium]|nr:nitroreductase family protein [Acidimicrobiales bacterium]
MELSEVRRRRRMVRSFDGRPVGAAVVDRVLDAARRVPSAGFSQGLDLVVLEGRDQTERYWAQAFPEPGARDAFRWPGLFAAPVLVMLVVHPGAYHERYAEADKAGSALADPGRWSVPWWWVDGGMAALSVLLAAVDEGLGALLFSVSRPEAVLASLGVPAGHRALACVALGHPAPDPPGRSASRARRPFADVVHRGHW